MTEKLNRSAVENLSSQLGEPGWMTERRLNSFDVFEKLDVRSRVQLAGVVARRSQGGPVPPAGFEPAHLAPEA